MMPRIRSLVRIQFFTHTVGISGSMMQWTALVKLNLPQNQADSAATVIDAADASDAKAEPVPSHRHWNAIRYTLASMQICYYTIHGAGVDDQEWSAMMERGLLGGDEMRALQSYPGNQPWLALCWAVTEVTAQVHAEAKKEDGMAEVLARDRLFERFRELAEKMRWHYGQIINGRKMQVPFFSMHYSHMI